MILKSILLPNDDVSCMDKNCNGGNGENGLVPHILQNIFYVPQKKESHSVLKRHEGELIMTIFIFGWTIPKTKTCFDFVQYTVSLLKTRQYLCIFFNCQTLYN